MGHPLSPSLPSRFGCGARGAIALAACIVPELSHGQELVPPSLIACDTPAYPVGIDVGAQRVVALLRIDEDGVPVAASEWQGDPLFVAALDPAWTTCRFTPALEDGAPVVVDLPFAWDWAEPEVNVEGRLSTRGDRRPVAGAAIRLDPVDDAWEGRLVTTDPTGRFAVRNLGPGPYRVSVIAPGFRVADATLDGPATASEVIDWELLAWREQTTSDELVAVYEPNEPGPTRRTLDRDAIRAVPGSLGDPVRALQTQPGFARSPFDAGWLLVRGGDFDDTGLFLDGVRIPLLYHVGGFTSVLHPELTRSVTFWPGAQPARYQGTSGAVDVQPADVGDQARVVAGVNLAWAHAFVEVPTRFGGFALAARRSYLDAVLGLVLGAESAQIAPRFADVQGRLQLGDASFTAIGLQDSFDAPSIEGGILTVSQAGEQLQGRIPIDVGDGQVVIWPWVARHARAITGDVSEEQSLVERFPGLRVAWMSSPKADLRFEAGFEGEYRDWTLGIDTREYQSPGGRVDPWVQASAGRDVVIESGIRLDTLWVRDQLPRAALSPRTSVRWKLHRDLSVHGEIGRFHAIPAVTLMIGLPEGAYLPLERSDLLAGGLRAKRGQFQVEFDAYRRQMAHVTALEGDGSLGQLVGRARGLETQASWHPERGALSVLYQYTRSEQYEDNADPEDNLPPITDQPHRVQLLGVVHLPRSWTLSSRFRYSSGFPRFHDSQTGLDIPYEAFDLLTQETLPVSDPSSARLRPFHALDVKVAREFQQRKWRLDVWLDVQNIYNRRVAEPLITGFGETASSYGFGLPILPLFGVEGVWWPRAKDADRRNVTPESRSSIAD